MKYGKNKETHRLIYAFIAAGYALALFGIDKNTAMKFVLTGYLLLAAIA